MTTPKTPASFELGDDPEIFTLARVGWLIRLRCFAILGIAVAALLAALGAFPSVRWSVLVVTAAGAAVYNFLLWRSYRHDAALRGGWAGTVQALGDMLLLTVVLWAAGGAECPFVSYYVFHVAIVGILAGPRATQQAAVTAMIGTGFLVLSSEIDALRIGRWDPVPPWDFIAEAVAFVSTVGTVAYLVTHAVSELRDREKALKRARDDAALEYELLSNTLFSSRPGSKSWPKVAPWCFAIAAQKSWQVIERPRVCAHAADTPAGSKVRSAVRSTLRLPLAKPHAADSPCTWRVPSAYTRCLPFHSPARARALA